MVPTIARDHLWLATISRDHLWLPLATPYHLVSSRAPNHSWSHRASVTVYFNTDHLWITIIAGAHLWLTTTVRIHTQLESLQPHWAHYGHWRLTKATVIIWIVHHTGSLQLLQGLLWPFFNSLVPLLQSLQPPLAQLGCSALTVATQELPWSRLAHCCPLGLTLDWPQQSAYMAKRNSPWSPLANHGHSESNHTILDPPWSPLAYPGYPELIMVTLGYHPGVTIKGTMDETYKINGELFIWQ